VYRHLPYAPHRQDGTVPAAALCAAWNGKSCRDAHVLAILAGIAILLASRQLRFPVERQNGAHTAAAQLGPHPRPFSMTAYALNSLGLTASPRTGTPEEFNRYGALYQIDFRASGANSSRLRPLLTV
jgi:hypothetical protein